VAFHGHALGETVPYWRLDRFGESAVELRFTVDRGEPFRDRNLVISHCVSRREYVPFGGYGALHLELDGRDIATLRVTWDGLTESQLILPKQFLTRGTHVLALRLADATTTYRLRGVRLESAE
jgi:hypothetical protein